MKFKYKAITGLVILFIAAITITTQVWRIKQVNHVEEKTTLKQRIDSLLWTKSVQKVEQKQDSFKQEIKKQNEKDFSDYTDDELLDLFYKGAN